MEGIAQLLIPPLLRITLKAVRGKRYDIFKLKGRFFKKIKNVGKIQILNQIFRKADESGGLSTLFLSPD